MTKQDKIDELEFKLNSLYNFVEMMEGKQAVHQLKRATDLEYAVLKTNKALEITDWAEFDDYIQRMNNEQYKQDKRQGK